MGDVLKRRCLFMTIEEIETALRESAEVRDAILWQAYASTVALFAVLEHGQVQSLELAGTGTLVEVDDSQYILTAAHVWEEVLKAARKVGISLPENRDHSFLMDIRTVVPVGPPKPDAWNEWGPDVIFLRIPQAHVGAIRAFRAFYSLSFKGVSQQEKIALKTTHLELWAFIGAPHEFGKFPAKNYADIQINAFFASDPIPHSKDGFDFLDFKAETVFRACLAEVWQPLDRDPCSSGSPRPSHDAVSLDGPFLFDRIPVASCHLLLFATSLGRVSLEESSAPALRVVARPAPAAHAVAQFFVELGARVPFVAVPARSYLHILAKLLTKRPLIAMCSIFRQERKANIENAAVPVGWPAECDWGQKSLGQTGRSPVLQRSATARKYYRSRSREP